MTIALYVFWLTAAVYGWALVGYPALMTLVGKIARPRREDQAELPTVTMIIPAYNEESVIRAKISNALEVDYPKDRLEILVASDGSSDRTVSIAEGYQDAAVRVLSFANRRGKASVLNDVVAAAGGEVLCLSDANVMFRPDAISRLVARLNDPKVGAVSGEVRLASQESNFGEGESWYYRMERAMQLGESLTGSMIGVDGGMYVIRRELFRPLEADTVLDDFTTTMHVIQQRRRVVYEPNAVATENGTPLARQEFRRRVRVTAGAVQSIKRGKWPPLARPVELWQYISHKLLRWLGPVWLILLLVSSAVLCSEGTIYRIALAGQLAVYLLAAAATGSLRLRQTRPGGIAFYFVMSHVAMTWGLLKGTLNLQRGVWTRTERTGVNQEQTTAGNS